MIDGLFTSASVSNSYKCKTAVSPVSKKVFSNRLGMNQHIRRVLDVAKKVSSQKSLLKTRYKNKLTLPSLPIRIVYETTEPKAGSSLVKFAGDSFKLNESNKKVGGEKVANKRMKSTDPDKRCSVYKNRFRYSYQRGRALFRYGK